MVRVPGSLVALLTFPGFIMHEVAHALFCRLCHLPVDDVSYFDVDGDSAFGYVRHARTNSLFRQFLVSAGPALIGLPLGGAIALPGYLHLLHPPVLSSASMWLGLSLMMHAFPSLGDAAAFGRLSSAASTPPLLRRLSRPALWGLYAAGALSGNLLGLLCCGLTMECLALRLAR